MKTLNKCLNELDRIIIGDVLDGNLILGILNYVRKCIFIRICIFNLFCSLTGVIWVNSVR